MVLILVSDFDFRISSKKDMAVKYLKVVAQTPEVTIKLIIFAIIEVFMKKFSFTDFDMTKLIRRK